MFACSGRPGNEKVARRAAARSRRFPGSLTLFSSASDDSFPSRIRGSGREKGRGTDFPSPRPPIPVPRVGAGYIAPAPISASRNLRSARICTWRTPSRDILSSSAISLSVCRRPSINP